jgi:hypothetical protein
MASAPAQALLPRALGCLLSAAVAASSAALCAGCASSPAMRAAQRGDRAALRDSIASRESAGTLSNGDAASIAREVAGRELRSAPPAEASARVRDALACARELDDALSDRMRVHDAAGADAALARIAGRGLSLGAARAFVTDTDSRWRAVGVRALVRSEDGVARRRALLDDDPLVRRQAARAARDAADAADFTALGEAARLDPEPIVRTETVRALAALPSTPGGQMADLLRDLWTGGDEGLREDIALAWSAPSVWNAGGKEALDRLVAAGHGSAAIEASAAVLRHGDAPAGSVQAAIGQLARSIDAGPRATRLQALAQAPLDRGDLLAAVQRASSDEDFEVRVGALARLAASGSASRGPAGQTADAVAALEALAQPGSPAAPRARFALASAGDRRVQAWIEGDLTAGAPEDRLGAATSLATLGVPARAAPLLADADAGVRVRAACAIVMGARSAR